MIKNYVFEQEHMLKDYVCAVLNYKNEYEALVFLEEKFGFRTCDAKKELEKKIHDLGIEYFKQRDKLKKLKSERAKEIQKYQTWTGPSTFITADEAESIARKDCYQYCDCGQDEEDEIITNEDYEKIKNILYMYADMIKSGKEVKPCTAE